MDPGRGRFHRTLLGITLVEVVAGIALLSTLLVSILVTFRANSAQVRASQERLAAIATADRLLTEWSVENKFPAVGSQQPLAGEGGMSWRLVRAKSFTGIPSGVQAVRLEVCRTAITGPEQRLASVELLIGGSVTRQVP